VRDPWFVLAGLALADAVVWVLPELAARRYGVTLISTQVFLAPDSTEFDRHQGYLSLPLAEALVPRMGVEAK